MAERFYVNCELSPAAEVVLHGPEAHHLAAVCRARVGDVVCLFNGDGQEYPARIVDVSRRDVTLEVVSRESPARELPHLLHLATPLPKGDRAWFLVEKLTELGVGVLTILETERSVVQAREAKVEKLQRYVVEASKQCGRNVLMRLDGPRRWAEFVQDAALPAARMLAHPSATGTTASPQEVDVVAAVGPEGGFAEHELTQALNAGWRCVALGPRILRIETAALALAARLQ